MPASKLTSGARLQYGPLAKLAQGIKTGYDLARAGVGLSRGPNQSSETIAAAWSNTWPAPGATLDLDFANDRGFVRGVGQGRSMDAVTFTRASNGNWVDSTGLLRTGAGSFPGTANATGVNLVSSPQNFDGSSWTKTNSSILANATVAADGTFTAQKLIENTANNAHGFYPASGFTPVNGNSYTWSVYAKASERSFLVISAYLNTDYYTYFDLINGTVGNNASGSTASITSVGNGWYRCAITRTSTVSTGGSFGMYSATTNGTVSYTGDGTSGLFIWGAQLELGSTATTYYPTNINAPRFDWASTAQLPPFGTYQATTTAAVSPNIILQSQTFNQSPWSVTFSTVVATSATTDPFGGTAAFKLQEDNTTNNHLVQQSANVGFATSYTYSMYVKAAERNYVLLYFFGIAAGGAYFNLTDGTSVNYSTAPDDKGSSYIGNGWWRIWIRKTTPSGGGSLTFQIYTSDNGTRFSGFGTAGYGVYIYGAQVEQSAFNTPLAANPTSNGLLIEESRTNRLLWCRDATQSNWTKTNVTAAKTATGIDGVANAASSLTASSTNGTCIQTVTLASGSRTGSVYLKRITGTGNIQVTLDGSTWSTVDLSNGLWNRIVLSGTVTNPTVGILIATSGDAVAMDYGQIEDGAFATTPILTTTATATRSADVATMSGSNFVGWWNGLTGSISAQAMPYYPTNVSMVFDVFGITAASDRVYTGFEASRVRAGVASNNLNVIKASNVLTANAFYRMSLAFKPSDFGQAVNGFRTVAYSTNTNPNYPPRALTTLYVGSESGQYYLNGCIKRITFFPKWMSDDALSTITGGNT